MERNLSNKWLIRIVVIALHACVLLVIAHYSGWLRDTKPVKDKTVQEVKARDDKKEAMEVSKSEEKKNKTITKKIHIPDMSLITKKISNAITEVCTVDDSKREQNNSLTKVPDSPIVVQEEANRTNNLKSAQQVKQEDPSSMQKNELVENDKKKSFVSPELKKDIKRFDFSNYQKTLMEKAALEEGEVIPALFLNDHGNKEIYKEGLRFYTYKLIARPEKLPEKPHYFIVKDSRIEYIQERCPYVGNFPSVLHEDRVLFNKLLSLSHLRIFSNTEYELFYAPVNISMLKLLQCKQKLILDDIHLAVTDVSGMTGSFKRVGDSYILIIESVYTKDGKSIGVDDPDV